jgi:DNA-binding MarR family transcriptional regulator
VDAYAQRLEDAKSQSTFQLLFRAARLVDEAARARIRAADPAVDLRAAHMALLPHLALEGSRITDLAARIGITKQAVGQLVDDLVALGVVERAPDPRDGRARLVRFTARGRDGLLHGVAELRAMETELASAVGPGRMDALQDALRALLAALEPAP